jgi:hypothetical protein
MIGEQARQAELLVALAGPPDGGLIALHALGHAAAPLSGRDGEHNPRTANLVPGQGPSPSDPR